MLHQDFLDAFAALGARLSHPTEIVLAGGSALILLGLVNRETGDTDVVESHPKLSTFAEDIEAVADALDLPTDWLNDGVRAHRDLLPLDYRTRLRDVGTFGQLTVRALGRLDLLIMKMAAARPRDLDDLAALAPTSEEIAFVETQLDRIAHTAPHDALRMQLYLEQKRGHQS